MRTDRPVKGLGHSAIVGLAADGEVLSTNRLPDIEKVRPMLWGSISSMAYYAVGERLGNAFSVGNELKRG
jgi:hypothetical protein